VRECQFFESIIEFFLAHHPGGLNPQGFPSTLTITGC
jgi:hypothetical protein